MRPCSLLPLLAVALVIGGAACSEDASQELPEALVGTWTTSDPAYADRHLRISRLDVAFGTGTYSEDANLLIEVRSHPGEGSSVRYTLRYRSLEGSDGEISLSFVPGPPDYLKLAYRDEVWTRSGGAGE